jgi:translation initiation factor 1
MNKKKKSDDEESRPAFTDSGAGPFNNVFASLKAGAEPTRPSVQPTASKDVKRRPAPARAVVRMERKGHGGKEVTIVEQLELSPQELASWLKLLKQSLGCGGAVESGALILQGDHRERIKRWLEAHGVKKISVG